MKYLTDPCTSQQAKRGIPEKFKDFHNLSEQRWSVHGHDNDDKFRGPRAGPGSRKIQKCVRLPPTESGHVRGRFRGWNMIIYSPNMQIFQHIKVALFCQYYSLIIHYTIIDWWWGQHIICCQNPQSIIVLLYLHWFRIKYSIQIIHKQTDHDQTGLNLDELIWDELALVWINSYTITPVHVI